MPEENYTIVVKGESEGLLDQLVEAIEAGIDSAAFTDSDDRDILDLSYTTRRTGNLEVSIEIMIDLEEAEGDDSGTEE